MEITKNKFWLLSVALILSIVFGMTGCGASSSETTPPPAEPVADDAQLEQAVATALVKEASTGYLEGECVAEGHRILGSEKDTATDELIVYALTMVGNYGFENNHFIKISGSGAIPAKLFFDTDGNCLRIQYPEDGAHYDRSLKEMFPAAYLAIVSPLSEVFTTELTQMEQNYARKYLEEIGRSDAEIGDYGDFEHILLTDVGVSVEASNHLLEDYSSLEQFVNYPYWLGNCEKLEDGIRYSYETAYDTATQQILYTKRLYDTQEVVEQYCFDGTTGDIIEN